MDFTNSAAVKARSYDVRRIITMEGDYSSRDPRSPQVTLTALVSTGAITKGAQYVLRDTTNAGFRGIECSFTDAAGKFLHGYSLGLFDAKRAH